MSAATTATIVKACAYVALFVLSLCAAVIGAATVDYVVWIRRVRRKQREWNEKTKAESLKGAN